MIAGVVGNAIFEHVCGKAFVGVFHVCRGARQCVINHLEEVRGRHDQRAESSAEIANAAVASDNDNVATRASRIDVPFDYGVGSEMAGREYDFESRRAAVWGVGFRAAAAPVEYDLCRFAGGAAVAGDAIDEGIARGFEVRLRQRLQLRALVDDIVAVD